MLAQLRALWLQVAVRCAKLEVGTARVNRVIREAGDRVPILDPLADKAKVLRYLLKVFWSPMRVSRRSEVTCDPHRTELVDAWVIGRIRVGNDSLWARVVRSIRESLGE